MDTLPDHVLHKVISDLTEAERGEFGRTSKWIQQVTKKYVKQEYMQTLVNKMTATGEWKLCGQYDLDNKEIPTVTLMCTKPTREMLTQAKLLYKKRQMYDAYDSSEDAYIIKRGMRVNGTAEEFEERDSFPDAFTSVVGEHMSPLGMIPRASCNAKDGWYEREYYTVGYQGIPYYFARFLEMYAVLDKADLKACVYSYYARDLHEFADMEPNTEEEDPLINADYFNLVEDLNNIKNLEMEFKTRYMHIGDNLVKQMKKAIGSYHADLDYAPNIYYPANKCIRVVLRVCVDADENLCDPEKPKDFRLDEHGQLFPWYSLDRDDEDDEDDEDDDYDDE